MSFLRAIAMSWGASGIALALWAAVHVLMPTDPSNDNRKLWALLAVLNLAPAAGLFVSEALPKLPRNAAVTLFMGWAGSSAAVLCLDALAALLGGGS